MKAVGVKINTPDYQVLTKYAFRSGIVHWSRTWQLVGILSDNMLNIESEINPLA